MHLRSVFAALFSLHFAVPSAYALEPAVPLAPLPQAKSEAPLPAPAASDVIGAVISYTSKKGENLSTIAQKFGVGYVELQAANPEVNPNKIKPGTQITVNSMHLKPSIAREGIVVNLETSRLFYFKDGKEVLTFPVASGKKGWETPTGMTKVYNKRKDPIWTPPPRIRAESPDLPDFIEAGPNNPLGKYAISVGLDGIMFHGTNAPSSVGKKVSHGCMRMYAADIEKLFKAVKVGTPVLLMRSSHEIGWQGDTMFLQLAPKVKKMRAGEVRMKPDLDLFAKIQQAAGPGAKIDWVAVEDAVVRADGIPVAVATRAPEQRDAMIAPPDAPAQTPLVPERRAAAEPGSMVAAK
ncbi:MAG TPA: L,D-transpeptidase family protein [Patescibacteria group bacterium]|nr:L,D-transpeptidase family protein [Patescibacteria group bacterium]